MNDLEIHSWTLFIDCEKLLRQSVDWKLQGVSGKAVEKSTGYRR